MKKEVKDELVKLITDKINTTHKLPWDKGTLEDNFFFPVNWKTGKCYRGINMLLLSFLGNGTQEYMTYKQAQEAGGQVQKGAKAFPVIFWSPIISKKDETEIEEEDVNPVKIKGFYKKYSVFPISMIDGIETRREIKTKNNARREDVDAFISAVIKATGVKVIEETGCQTAYYRPSTHEVHIAPVNEYQTTEAWTATVLHELIHSTGKAMGRKNENEFGSTLYSKEEVVAEFGSALLCREFGIFCQEDNTAAYLQSWSEKLKQNPDWLISGANKAQAAVDYLLKVSGFEHEADNSEVA